MITTSVPRSILTLTAATLREEAEAAHCAWSHYLTRWCRCTTGHHAAGDCVAVAYRRTNQSPPRDGLHLVPAHWHDWQLAEITTRVTTMRGVAFEPGDRVLVQPAPVSDLPPVAFATAYSWRNNGNTAVPARSVSLVVADDTTPHAAIILQAPDNATVSSIHACACGEAPHTNPTSTPGDSWIWIHFHGLVHNFDPDTAHAVYGSGCAAEGLTWSGWHARNPGLDPLTGAPYSARSPR